MADFCRDIVWRSGYHNSCERKSVIGFSREEYEQRTDQNWHATLHCPDFGPPTRCPMCDIDFGLARGDQSS